MIDKIDWKNREKSIIDKYNRSIACYKRSYEIAKAIKF